MGLWEDDAHTTIIKKLSTGTRVNSDMSLKKRRSVFDQIQDQAVGTFDDDDEPQAKDTEEPPAKQRRGPGKERKVNSKYYPAYASLQ